MALAGHFNAPNPVSWTESGGQRNSAAQGAVGVGGEACDGPAVSCVPDTVSVTAVRDRALGVLQFLGSAAGEPSVDSGPGEVPSSD